MRRGASVGSRIRVAVACGLVLALFGVGFGMRIVATVDELPTAELHGAALDLAILLGIGALACGTAIALVAANIAVAPVEALTQTARAMRRDLGIRTRLRGEDEAGQLGEALDDLAAWVGSEKQSLEDDRNRLVAILESMAEGVLVTSATGTIVLANAALRQMFLLDRAIIGRPPIEVIRVAGLDEILESAEDGGAGAGEIELGGLRPRRVFVRVAPIQTSDPSQRPGLVAVFNDVTELRRLENVRRDFVANVSHELRTPIAAISSSAETLLGGALDDEETSREFVAIITRHAKRLQNLVEDLLELSAIEAKEWRLAMEDVDPDEITAAAVEAIAVAAAEKGVTVTRTVERPLPPVRADRRALEQILVNLLDNAVKYGGANVALVAERRGDHVVFRVRDRGPGIEPRHLERIFERFYRVDAGRSRAVGGTGLGLSIVKNLVEALQGTVEVESTVGAGTTFTVTLSLGVAPVPDTSSKSG